MQRGYTPLYYASEQGRNDLIQLLIEHGAVVDLPTDVSDSQVLTWHCRQALCTWIHYFTVQIFKCTPVADYMTIGALNFPPRRERQF